MGEIHRETDTQAANLSHMPRKPKKLRGIYRQMDGHGYRKREPNMQTGGR
jgi:hypothetical protein